MMPALGIEGDVEYVWYVSDPVQVVGLWKRTPRYEFPLYQNTRGQAVFNAADADEGNADEYEPTDAFWQAIEQLTEPIGEGEPIDVRDCEWYEREFISEVMGLMAEHEGDDIPAEIGQLLASVDGGDDE